MCNITSKDIKKYRKSVFVFRRDLRLQDNTGLIESIKNSDLTICCFIFDPLILNNPSFYRPKLFKFLKESLQDLEENISALNGKLFYFYGIYDEIIKSIFKAEKIEAVYLNRDYTTYSINRDRTILELCKKNDVNFYQYNDLLLTRPEQVKNKNDWPYTVFSYFYKSALKLPVNHPQKLPSGNDFFVSRSTIQENDISSISAFKSLNISLDDRGGRSACEEILANISKFKNYDNDKNYPYLDLTTRLSAHIKFGNCSIREIYYKILEEFGIAHPLIRQLYWRDFFTHIGFHFPHVFKKAFKKRFQKIKWIFNSNKFLAWCNGQTGFPIVDAGMRQLNSTGFMHNRVRMVTASFLVKDLHINWFLGERYFSSKLIDYDPCVNNGNWQWAASTGCDSQPYFRIFNPWLQQKKFDPDCIYIKKWIPELQNVSNNIIHNWKENHNQVNNIKYPVPIVEHEFESMVSKKIFSSATDD